MGKLSQGFTGEILHFNAARFRITGTGVLRSQLSSLNDVNQSTFVNLTMESTTNREPTLLNNYKDQRGRLEGTTVNINERFSISKIIIYIKPIASGYPQ